MDTATDVGASDYGGEQDPVGDGVEHPTDGGDLVEASGQLGVDPVGGTERGQQQRSRPPVTVVRLSEEP